MSNFKVQMSNQIQSSNEMPKSLDPELSSGSGSAWQGCHSELGSESNFGIWYFFDICLPARSPASRSLAEGRRSGEGRDFDI